MSIPITIQLPDPLYTRVVQASEERGVSPERVVIDTLRLGLPQHDRANTGVNGDETPPKPLGEMTPQERLNWELRAIARPLTMEEIASLAWGSEENVPLLSHEELLSIMPRLDPPISQTVSEMREDRV